ncbi:hypothetical protein [Fictibacillus phosphorivorans]|uniref:hypothetical protein n=1 Tax=Fictibacillus phosphorivorans TaxID=1221500 RepID=UPI00203CEDF5|nr:hypothetical protein [Fictibacillus phosphorivorans]MCM3718744.1 hypothetical protein [Fictibacillus phosphorivorans]MCM3776367.1 hypothetical protein [Fictibacillus phosphorivorans]
MFKYGFTNYFEGILNFTGYEINKVGPWLNVYLSFEIENVEILPEGLNEPSALVVYDHEGELQDIIAQDEGVDCEYKFTDKEKEQIQTYLERINEKHPIKGE